MGVVIVAALTYMYFEDFACVLLIRVYIYVFLCDVYHFM